MVPSSEVVYSSGPQEPSTASIRNRALAIGLERSALSTLDVYKRQPQAQVNAGGRSHGDHSAKKLPSGQDEKDGLLVLADFLGNFDLDKKSPHILAKI